MSLKSQKARVCMSFRTLRRCWFFFFSPSWRNLVIPSFQLGEAHTARPGLSALLDYNWIYCQIFPEERTTWIYQFPIAVLSFPVVDPFAPCPSCCTGMISHTKTFILPPQDHFPAPFLKPSSLRAEEMELESQRMVMSSFAIPLPCLNLVPSLWRKSVVDVQPCDIWGFVLLVVASILGTLEMYFLKCFFF